MAKRSGRATAPRGDLNAIFADALAKQRAGRTAEAVGLYEKAIRRDPGVAEVHNNLGCALMALGRLDGAAAALGRAVKLRPDYAEALDTLGVVLAELGRPGEAVTYLERAAAADPQAAAPAFHRGNALLALGRLAEARAAFEHALMLDPRNAPAQNGIGAALAREGDETGAAAAFRAALALDPGFADAAGNLGRIQLEAGDLTEAVASFERAIELNPANSHFYLELVRSRSGPLDAGRLATMEALGAPGRGLGRPALIDLNFGLAKAYEDAGRYDDAFRRLTTGNALKRLEVSYNEAADLGFLGQLGRTIDGAAMRNAGGYGNPAAGPIFIFGMARSGSSLIEQILAAHPQVRALGETAAFGTLLAEVRPPIGTNAPPAEVGDALRTIADRYLAGTAAAAGGKTFVTDKTLANFALAPLILMALPNARLIHVRRDPLDTCFSCYATLFLGSYVSFSYELGELARYYGAYSRLMAAWRAILPPDRFIEVGYADVVTDFETQVRRLLAFCGLPWDAACLDFPHARRSVRTASAFQVRRPLYADAIGRAGRFATHLKPLVAALGAEGVFTLAPQPAPS